MLEQVCRLCMSTEHLVWLFDAKLTKGIADIVKITSGVEITLSDSVSQMVCDTCLQVSLKIYHFRTKCMKNDSDLKGKSVDSWISKLPKSILKKKEISSNDCGTRETTNTESKFNVLPTALKPRTSAVQVRISTNEVDNWFRSNNYTDAQIDEIKNAALELANALTTPSTPQKEINVINLKKQQHSDQKYITATRRTQHDSTTKVAIPPINEGEGNVHNSIVSTSLHELHNTVSVKNVTNLNSCILGMAPEKIRTKKRALLKEITAEGKKVNKSIEQTKKCKYATNKINTSNKAGNSRHQIPSGANLNMTQRKTNRLQNKNVKTTTSETKNNNISLGKEKSEELSTLILTLRERFAALKGYTTDMVNSTMELTSDHQKAEIDLQPRPLSILIPSPDTSKQTNTTKELSSSTPGAQLVSNSATVATPLALLEPISRTQTDGINSLKKPTHDKQLFEHGIKERPSVIVQTDASKKLTLSTPGEQISLNRVKETSPLPRPALLTPSSTTSEQTDASKVVAKSTFNHQLSLHESRQSPFTSEQDDASNQLILLSPDKQFSFDKAKAEFVHSLNLIPRVSEYSNVPDSSLWTPVNRSCPLFTCKICDSHFNNARRLRYHMQKMHTRCPFCRKRFRSLEIRKDHINRSCSKNRICPKIMDIRVPLIKVDDDEKIKRQFPGAFKDSHLVETDEVHQPSEADANKEFSGLLGDFHRVETDQPSESDANKEFPVLPGDSHRVETDENHQLSFVNKETEEIIYISDDESSSKMKILNTDHPSLTQLDKDGSIKFENVIRLHHLRECKRNGAGEVFDNQNVLDSTLDPRKFFKNLRRLSKCQLCNCVPIKIRYSPDLHVHYEAVTTRRTEAKNLWYDMEQKQLTVIKVDVNNDSTTHGHSYDENSTKQGSNIQAAPVSCDLKYNEPLGNQNLQPLNVCGMPTATTNTSPQRRLFLKSCGEPNELLASAAENVEPRIQGSVDSKDTNQSDQFNGHSALNEPVILNFTNSLPVRKSFGFKKKSASPILNGAKHIYSNVTDNNMTNVVFSGSANTRSSGPKVSKKRATTATSKNQSRKQEQASIDNRPSETNSLLLSLLKIK